MSNNNQNNSKPLKENEIKNIISLIEKDYTFLNLSSEDIYKICFGGGYHQIPNI